MKPTILTSPGTKLLWLILPAFFSDNFFSLLPGESHTIRISVKAEDCRGEKPLVDLCGFNLETWVFDKL